MIPRRNLTQQTLPHSTCVQGTSIPTSRNRTSTPTSGCHEGSRKAACLSSASRATPCTTELGPCSSLALAGSCKPTNNLSSDCPLLKRKKKMFILFKVRVFSYMTTREAPREWYCRSSRRRMWRLFLSFMLNISASEMVISAQYKNSEFISWFHRHDVPCVSMHFCSTCTAPGIQTRMDESLQRSTGLLTYNMAPTPTVKGALK